MYAVREKRTKKVIHINPAPLFQQLDGKDVFHEFDGRTMEIGRIEGPLPEHFDITDDGEIVELDLEAKVEAGIVELEPDQTIRDGEIVEKTLAEMVADGLVTLEPEQKVEGERIVRKSRAELLDEGLVSLDELKSQRKTRLIADGIQKREEILPTQKVLDALLGIDNVDELPAYKKTIESFRKEQGRLAAGIDAANSIATLDGVKARFPTRIARTGTGRDLRTRKKSKKTVGAKKKAKKAVSTKKAKKTKKTKKKRTNTR